jgi:hypothetical protein
MEKFAAKSRCIMHLQKFSINRLFGFWCIHEDCEGEGKFMVKGLGHICNDCLIRVHFAGSWGRITSPDPADISKNIAFQKARILKMKEIVEAAKLGQKVDGLSALLQRFLDSIAVFEKRLTEEIEKNDSLELIELEKDVVRYKMITIFMNKYNIFTHTTYHPF